MGVRVCSTEEWILKWSFSGWDMKQYRGISATCPCWSYSSTVATRLFVSRSNNRVPRQSASLAMWCSACEWIFRGKIAWMWPGPLVRMSHFQTSIQAANLNPALFQHYNSIRKIIRGKILFSIERSMLERKQACGVTVEAGEAVWSCGSPLSARIPE